MGVPYRDEDVERPSTLSDGTGDRLKVCEVAEREIRDGIESLLANPVLEDFELGRPASVREAALGVATGSAPSEVFTRVRGESRLVDELEGVNECVLLSRREPTEA
jgi:hypothetical protein